MTPGVKLLAVLGLSCTLAGAVLLYLYVPPTGSLSGVSRSGPRPESHRFRADRVWFPVTDRRSVPLVGPAPLNTEMELARARGLAPVDRLVPVWR